LGIWYEEHEIFFIKLATLQSPKSQKTSNEGKKTEEQKYLPTPPPMKKKKKNSVSSFKTTHSLRRRQ
jgi:hypothetical protein